MSSKSNISKQPDKTTKRKKTGGKDFIKGQSGNSEGRPFKGTTYKELMEFYTGNYTLEELNEIYEEEKLHAKDMIVVAQVIRACEGKIRNAELVMNRTEGMPKQPLDISGTENPLNILVERRNGNSIKNKDSG